MIIICHSYGCPFVHYFLTEKLEEGWKNRYVRGVIGIAGAWAGNFHALHKFLSIEPHDLLSKLVPGIMRTERTFTSNISLLPRVKVWKDVVLIRTKEKNYTANDMEQILHASNNGRHFVDALKQISKTSDRFPAPGTDLHCISGKGIPTRSALVLETAFWAPDAVSKVELADGDGCLLLRSQSSCRLWKEETESSGHEFTYKEMSLSHMQLIQDKEAISYTMKLIRSMS